MTKMTSLYCIPTNTSAHIEQDFDAGFHFSRIAYTLTDEDAAKNTADHAYRTERGFDAACRRLTGYTVAEHERGQDETIWNQRADYGARPDAT